MPFHGPLRAISWQPLAAVADAQQCQREGVRTRVERLELYLQLLVVQDRRRPPARRLQHVRVVEPAHKHDAAEALQRDKSAISPFEPSSRMIATRYFDALISHSSGVACGS